ncbi:MAG: lipoprotein, partial [Chloroflexi bacterium]|nr:lipoprotein [Chloroflexota bacterium]
MKKIWIYLIIFTLLLTGCNSPDQPAAQQNDDSAQVSSNEAIADNAAADDDQADSEAPAEITPLPPTDLPEPPTPEIVHWEFPGEFSLSPLQRIYDCAMGVTIIPGQPIEISEDCDQWDRNYFERPVDEGVVEYFPQLDIVQSEFGQDDLWYYTRIHVFTEGIEELILDGVYALEIDLNLDARGDILISAAAPGSYPADEWHSNGVQVWVDTNDDVGGPTAVLVDPRYDGDGYETLLVDSGVGEDPDLAFVKIYSEEPGLIEFGFKAGLLKDTDKFEWWVWAMGQDIGSGKYDPVDFFPQDTLFALDNTCGWIFGSYPRDLPNIC